MYLEHSCANEIERENLANHFHLTLTLFPKKIQSNFTLRLVCKKIEITIGPVNYAS